MTPPPAAARVAARAVAQELLAMRHIQHKTPQRQPANLTRSRRVPRTRRGAA